MTRPDLFVIYLHGFLSSPESKKAQQTIHYCNENGLGDNLLVPYMPGGPAETLEEIQQVIDSHKEGHIGLIGSSLGGYYATCLAEANNLKAVLINPAVRPYEQWSEYIGERKNYYSGDIHQITEEHVKELEDMDNKTLAYPENYMLLAKTADEVLDYRLSEARYQEGTCIIQEGGNHSFENYSAFLPIIFDFLAIKN
ncbi:MAG: esterase YqiA [Gammaproteobacteria bacterium]|nr:esterase YqiA [Gammaproteobacteria bacterium]